MQKLTLKTQENVGANEIRQLYVFLKCLLIGLIFDTPEFYNFWTNETLLKNNVKIMFYR